MTARLRTSILSALTAVGLILAGSTAASAAGEEIPFDLHGTIEGPEITFEWEEIPQAEAYQWTFNVAGTDGVFDSDEITETSAVIDVEEMGLAGNEPEDYLEMDLTLGFGVAGVFADPQQYYAFEQLRFQLVQLDDGSFTVGPPYSDPMLSEEEAEAHFAEHFTVVEDSAETESPTTEPSPTTESPEPTEEPAEETTSAEPEETSASPTPQETDSPETAPASQEDPLGGWGTALMIGLGVLGLVLIGVGIVIAVRRGRA